MFRFFLCPSLFKVKVSETDDSVKFSLNVNGNPVIRSSSCGDSSYCRNGLKACKECLLAASKPSLMKRIAFWALRVYLVDYVYQKINNKMSDHADSCAQLLIKLQRCLQVHPKALLSIGINSLEDTPVPELREKVRHVLISVRKEYRNLALENYLEERVLWHLSCVP